MRRLALSTSWNARRMAKGAEVVDSILDLSIKGLELSYNLEPGMAHDIIARIKETGVSIVSLHHPCPLPEGFTKDQASGEIYNPASLDEDERALAIRSLLETLEFAMETGARVVVLHAGNIPETRGAEHEMAELFQKQDEAWIGLRDELLRERERQMPARLGALMRVLDKTVPEYERAGVGLAIENRYFITDIPDIEEMSKLFEHYTPLLYWHDTGHGRARACWGLEGEHDSLEEFQGRLAGYHLHDAEGPRDHRAPAVPVGEDQVTHIEFTRDIVRRFNAVYGEVFPEPEALLTPVPRILGSDRKKMSKRYDNGIYLADPPDVLEKKLMGFSPTPHGLRKNDPGHPEDCPVFLPIKAFCPKGPKRSSPRVNAVNWVALSARNAWRLA